MEGDAGIGSLFATRFWEIGIYKFILEKMEKQNITVYEPGERRKIGFFMVWLKMFQNIRKSRELIYQLFRRDFLMAYKKSFIGLWWVALSPIVGIVSWIFLNSSGILKPGDVGIPYPAYVLLSSSIWGLFMGFFTSAAGTLTAGAGIITQVKYPHEALLMKQTAQHLAGFVITFAINIIILLIFHVVPSIWILLFPILILPLFFLGAGMGLIVSVISAVATDIEKIASIILGVVFFATPVIYAKSSMSPLFQKIVDWNPLTYLIGGVRDAVIYGRIENLDKFLLVSLGSLIFFMLAWRLFYVSEDKVIEKMI